MRGCTADRERVTNSCTHGVPESLPFFCVYRGGCEVCTSPLVGWGGQERRGEGILKAEEASAAALLGRCVPCSPLQACS